MRTKIKLLVLIFGALRTTNSLPLRRGRARVGVDARVGLKVGAAVDITPQHPHPNLPPFSGKGFYL